ncbi:MAG: NAD(P)/FAD-dependent oxidoreductase [Cyanobacterium sp.]
MDKFDVVVVGAGPGGGQCARLLGKKGYRVLLLERYKDFHRNSFSSAGTPLKTLTKFDLPPTVVGSWWNKFAVVTTNHKRVWESTKNQGCVLDFAKTCQFLADEVTSHGGQVWLGCRYMEHIERENDLLITIKNNLINQTIQVTSKVLVDASGPSRAVMCRKGKKKPPFISATGVEYLIEVDERIYDDNAATLTFLLGHQWMPRGYSWVFPMEQNLLKVGAGIYNQEHELIKEVQPLSYYIKLLIKEYLQADNYKILDIHGGTLKYSSGLQDTYTEGRVIAIGDAVSTVNWLGGEGIRHAMESAEIAHKFIYQFLRGKKKDFNGYQKKMHSVFLKKWNISEKLAHQKYSKDADFVIEKAFSYLDGMKLEDVVDILFYYKFEKVFRGLGTFTLKKLRQLFASIKLKTKT